MYKVVNPYFVTSLDSIEFDSVESAGDALWLAYPESKHGRGWYVLDDSGVYYVYDSAEERWGTIREWFDNEDRRIAAREAVEG